VSNPMPEVLVGGFARSGTSAVTMLITMMGIPAGKHLKPGEASNPRGYWECMPIRKAAWEAAGVHHPYWQHIPDTMPPAPLALRGSPKRACIAHLAHRYNAHVYKDSYLPLLYQLFPANAKYVVVRRGWRAVYDSAMATKARDIPPLQYRQAVAHYERLAKQMAQDVETLFVDYETFNADFDAEVGRLAAFLDKPLDRLEEMRREWYPNEEWYKRQGYTRAEWGKR